MDNPLRKTVIVHNRAFTIVIVSPEEAHVFWQAINPKTGKPWQRIHYIAQHSGGLANMKALRDVEKSIQLYRKEVHR